MQESFMSKGTVLGDEGSMGDRESENSGVGGGEYFGVRDALSEKGEGVMVQCVGMIGVKFRHI